MKEGLCADCARVKPVRVNRTTGKPQCRACYRSAGAEECARCHKVKPVGVRLSTGNVLCENCAHKARNTAFCNICGEMGVIAVRDPEIICRTCYNRDYKRPKAYCCLCMHFRPVHLRYDNGAAVCRRCFDTKFRPPHSTAVRNK